MEDRQVLDTIDDVGDAQERQRLLDQFAREGRSAAFWEALSAALERQAAQRREQRKPIGPARWVARQSGKFLGRAVRNLERQSIEIDEAAKRKQ